MRRETQNVLLLLLGGALLKIAWNGTYLWYVKPSLWPPLVAAGVVIVALAAIAIGRDLRAARSATPSAAGHPDCHPAGHPDHDHADHTGRSPWLLLLPVLAIFLVAPPALGADAVTRSGGTFGALERSSDRSPSPEFPPLPDGPVVPVRMSDFVTRAVWDDSGTLHGREVRLTGFIVHGVDGGTYLARLVIACCAADATPVRVLLEGGAPGGGMPSTGVPGAAADLATLPQDGWFEVRGRLVPGSANPRTRFVPRLTVSQLRPIPPPAEPYEF